MADDDDGFRQLVSTLRRHKLLRTNVTIQPLPLPHRRRPVARLRGVRATVHDRPRAQLPVLTHALRGRQQVRWYARCRRCGVAWSGRVLDVTQPASVLATLAVMRVPCPVCWAQAWASGDQATRAAWALVPSWITPRWR